MYHVDRILRETKEVVNNGFYEIYVNTQIDDGSNVAELMKIFKSTEVPENSKFPRICSGIKNLKIGKGRDSMCAIVEEYAEKKAKVAAKETASSLLKIGKLTIEEIASSIPLLSIEEIIELQKSLYTGGRKT